MTLLWGSFAWGGEGVAEWEEVLETPPQAMSWAQRVSERDGMRVLAVEGVGREGGTQHIDLLVGALSEPWPVGAAAGHALGEMGRRGVEGIPAVVPELVEALSRIDPRTRRAAAYGLRRIGLQSASPPHVEEVYRTWNSQADPQTRAWLVEALGALNQATREVDLWLEAMGDTSRLVQVAGMRFASDELEPEVLIPFLEDNDPWVRLETVRVLARHPGPTSGEAIERYRQNARDPWANIEGARARSVPTDLTSTHPMVRAAAARHQDGAALDRLVATDPHSVVRVGAAAEALDRHPTRDRARDYLTATDPLVQAIGAEMLAATGTQTDQALLLELVEQTDNEDTLRAGLAAIHAVSGGSLPRQTQARLDFLAQHPAPRIQAALTGAVDPEVRPAPQADRASSSGGTWMAHVDTSRGVFRIELRADWAPVAVENFIQLARDGFFDGQVFHRVVPGFVVQTGCPRGDGWGGPGHSIPDEVTRHPYVRGSVGMARAELNSAGSQWFVTTSDQPHLAGLYTQFGSVVQGRHVPQRLTVGDHIVSIRIEEVPQ